MKIKHYEPKSFYGETGDKGGGRSGGGGDLSGLFSVLTTVQA